MTNEKKSNMSAEQKLYPQLIYRINSILSDIKSDLEKDHKKGELFIAPSVLDPYTRTFNWLMVNDKKWKFLDRKERKDIENHIKSNREQFEKEFIRRKEMKTVSDAIDIVKESANKTDEKYHFALLSIYQFYPNNPKKYIDGIIYRNIARRAKERNGKNHRIDYAQVTLQCGEINENTYILYPWVEIDFFNNEGTPERKYSCQEFNPSDPEKEITKGYPANDNPDVDKPEEIKPLESESDYKEYGWGKLTPATLRTNHFHKNYFVPFFVKDEGFNLNEFYKLSPEYLSQRKYIYVKPLYDALYGEYGNLCAVLQIPFVNTTERDKFSDVENILINRLPFLVNEIKNAAFFEILKQPVEGDDLLEHFIKYLPMLQDWEYIRVFENKNGGEVILNYCYGRAKNGEWKKCPLRGSNCATKPECLIQINANSYELEDEELKKIIRDAKKKHIACNEIRFGKGHKHKALLENIFTEMYIPELDEYDKSKCENKIVIYEYPSYTIIPDDEPKEHKLGLFYERQQIDLLRQLAIKRKVILETIRHGTRAAVAAIMGRNMSHNIGSHVLSYLSNEDENEDKDKDKNKGKFYRYLQGRMDFIADISTTKPSWSSNVNFIEEIINPFVGVELQNTKTQVLPEQAKLLNNLLRSVAINHNNERICLDAKKIIIKVSYPAQTINMPDQQLTYKYFSSSKEVGLGGTLQEDFLLAIPHGSTGIHAFCSILENFLRNSGKHGGEGVNEILRDSKSTLECSIYVQRYDENLYKVTIRDNIKKDSPDEAISKINDYITGKYSTLINDDGSINQEGWGIKEMRISAAWLRGIEPKEVQNPLISPPLLNPVKTDIGGIGYEFYLLKPLDVLIVTNDSNINENPSKGIYIKKTTKELDDLVKNGGLRHKFVVFDNPDENIEKWIQEHYLSLPFSTFCISPQLDYHFLINKDSLLNGDIKNNLYKALREYITSKIDIQEEIKLAILEDALKPLSSIRNYILEPNTDKISSECIVFQHDYEDKKAYICGKNPLYYQEYSSVQRTGRRLRSLLEKEGEIGIHKIYISALSKIVIADERLFSKEMSKNSLEEWERMGIEIVDIKRSNNDIIVYKKDTKSSEAWNVYISKNKQTIFFSIHQAIIKDEIKEDIWNKMVEDLKRNKVFVLIHSGRGGVNITKGFKFVELTNIENMIDNRDKIGLTELFFHYVRGRQND